MGNSISSNNSPRYNINENHGLNSSFSTLLAATSAASATARNNTPYLKHPRSFFPITPKRNNKNKRRNTRRKIRRSRR